MVERVGIQLDDQSDGRLVFMNQTVENIDAEF